VASPLETKPPTIFGLWGMQRGKETMGDFPHRLKPAFERGDIFPSDLGSNFFSVRGNFHRKKGDLVVKLSCLGFQRGNKHPLGSGCKMGLSDTWFFWSHIEVAGRGFLQTSVYSWLGWSIFEFSDRCKRREGRKATFLGFFPTIGK